MKKIKGIEGCTFADTQHDSRAVAYGYNLAIDEMTETLEKKDKEILEMKLEFAKIESLVELALKYLDKKKFKLL